MLTSAIRRLRRYRSLPRSEQRVVVTAISLLIATRLALAVTSLDRWQGWLQRLSRSGAGNDLRTGGAESGRQVAESTARLLFAASRAIRPRPSCLHRSLVLQSLLAAHGISVQVRYGVRRKDGDFEAHAWVEHDGRTLTDPGDEHHTYAVLRSS